MWCSPDHLVRKIERWCSTLAGFTRSWRPITRRPACYLFDPELMMRMLIVGRGRSLSGLSGRLSSLQGPGVSGLMPVLAGLGTSATGFPIIRRSPVRSTQRFR